MDESDDTDPAGPTPTGSTGPEKENLRNIEPNEGPGRVQGMNTASAPHGVVGDIPLAVTIQSTATSSGPTNEFVQTSPTATYAGDFDTFYRTHYATVVRSLSITVGDAGLGREAADEAMTRAYANWSKIGGYENPAGWAYRVGLNWARSWHRRTSRRLPFRAVTSVELPPMADPQLDQALMQLDIKYRAVVVCRYLLDWSTEQTAEALDLRPGTVKSRLSTGLGQLRSALDMLAISTTSTSPEGQN